MDICRGDAHTHLAADALERRQSICSVGWKIWTIANTFGEIQQIISQEKMDGVKKAALIGTLRALMGSGEVSQADAERVIKSAGGYWEMAEKSQRNLFQRYRCGFGCPKQ